MIAAAGSEVVNGAVIGGGAVFLVGGTIITVMRLFVRTGTQVTATLPSGEVIDAEIVRTVPGWRYEVGAADGTRYVVRNIRRPRKRTDQQ